MNSTILQPAKHGFVIDLEDGARRTQVRVFEFEEQPFQGGVCEMPVPMTAAVAIARLREGMEAMRESLMDGETGRRGEEEKQNRLAACGTFSQRPILFLDVDGVLNRTPVEMGSLMPEKVALLDWIVKETRCRVVVISSWRYSLEKMKQLGLMFESLAGGAGVFMDHLPLAVEEKQVGPGEFVAWTKSRGDEIRDFLRGNSARFVVLDDEAVPGFEHEQVRTDSMTGLTEVSALAVIKRLNAGGVA